MGKPTICIGENKGADQRLCFRFSDSTIPLLSKSKISSLYPSSATVQPGLCRIPNCLFSRAQAQVSSKTDGLFPIFDVFPDNSC